MRFGIADSCLHDRVAPDFVTRQTRLLATLAGADSFWVPDHLVAPVPAVLHTRRHVGVAPLVPKVDGYYEPWTALGALAGTNRLHRLRLAVGSTDTARRNPVVTAQAAATLQQLSRGRAILGIGAGLAMDNVPYGVPFDRPVAMFEEGLATIRALWGSGGRPISRESPYFPLRDAVFGVPPYKGRWPELWVGAHLPRMLRAAGRYGDGWFPGVTMDPKDYRDGLATICDAADDAGRDPTKIVPAKYFFVVTDWSEARVEEALAAPMIRAYALCAPDEYWRRHGATHPVAGAASGVQDLQPQTWDEQTALAHVGRVPDSLIREFVLAGTPAQVLERLADWRDAGMTYPVMLNFGVIQPSALKGVATMAPFFWLLRRMGSL